MAKSPCKQSELEQRRPGRTCLSELNGGRSSAASWRSVWSIQELPGCDSRSGGCQEGAAWMVVTHSKHPSAGKG